MAEDSVDLNKGSIRPGRVRSVGVVARLGGFLLRQKASGVLISYAVVFLAFSLLSGSFLTGRVLLNILSEVVELGFIAIGVSFLMISGEFDLSIGALFATSAMFGGLLIKAGLNPLLALPIVLAITTLMGIVNGLVCLKGRIPSFIATLGMMYVWRALLLKITRGSIIAFSAHPMLSIFNLRINGFPLQSVYLLGAGAIFVILLDYTRHGNRVLATGRNERTARLMGINTFRVKLIGFALVGLLTGFSGFLNLCRFVSADPSLGLGMELEAIAAAVIGGNLITGGYGTIIGTLVGVFLMATIRSGLLIVGAHAYMYRGFMGALIVGATILNLRIRGRRIE